MWTVCFHTPLPFVSLIEIPATPHYRAATASPGACRASWRGEHPLGTVPTQTGISQGMGDWRVPKSPQQCSGGCTLGRASIIHCLLFINNLPSPSRPGLPPSQHTLTHLFPVLSAAHPNLHFSLFLGGGGGFHMPSFIVLTFRASFTRPASGVSFGGGASQPRRSDCLSNLSLPA